MGKNHYEDLAADAESIKARLDEGSPDSRRTSYLVSDLCDTVATLARVLYRKSLEEELRERRATVFAAGREGAQAAFDEIRALEDKLCSIKG